MLFRSEYINDVLVNLNITNITPNDLKLNATNLIDFTINNQQKGGRKKGGSNFRIIFKSLYYLAVIICVSLLDYYYITNQSVPEIYQRTKSIINNVIVVKDAIKKECNIGVPTEMTYFFKYIYTEPKSKQFVEDAYVTLSCIASNRVNKHLKEQIFVPRKVDKSNIFEESPEIMKENEIGRAHV